MTSLKSIMERRTMQVLDVRDMKCLKGGARAANANANANAGSITQNGGGLPPAG